MKPITPDEVFTLKKDRIPDVVIGCFNDLIAKYWNGRYSQFTQTEVVEHITQLGEFDRRTLFDNHYLDVEPIFEDAGWKVEYDKPGYNETHDATFKFYKKVL